MGRSRSRGDAEDAVIACLRENGFTLAAMAAGLGRHINHISRRIMVMGLARPALPAIEPLEGEEWRDRDDLGVRVSNLGRFASLKTGQLLRISRGPGHDYITVCVKTPQQTTRACHLLVSETFGLPVKLREGAWTPEEHAALLRSKTMVEAMRALPDRTECAIKTRAKKYRLKLIRHRAPVSEPVRGSIPWLDPIWSEAQAVVPRWMPQHERDDLISDLVLMRLEGRAPDMRAALKVAQAERNLMTGRFKERSIDAVISGTDNLRLIDTFDSEVERF